MYKKRIISCVLLVVCTLAFLFAGCTTSKEEIPTPTVLRDVYVYDEDNIIDDDVEQSLNSILVELEEKTEIEFAVISVESLLDNTIETYANELFNTLGIGKSDADNGILLLFSRSDRKVRLEIGRGLEDILNDSKCGRILDDYFVPYRESDEYTNAAYYTVNAVVNVLAEEYSIDIQNLDTTLSVEEDEPLTLKDIIIIFIIIIGAIVLLSIMGAVLGFDGNSSGGGSFGGGFSGGSSGGFGGGFSGGGGASR